MLKGENDSLHALYTPHSPSLGSMFESVDLAPELCERAVKSAV